MVPRSGTTPHYGSLLHWALRASTSSRASLSQRQPSRVSVTKPLCFHSCQTSHRVGSSHGYTVQIQLFYFQSKATALFKAELGTLRTGRFSSVSLLVANPGQRTKLARHLTFTDRASPSYLLSLDPVTSLLCLTGSQRLSEARLNMTGVPIIMTLSCLSAILNTVV